MAVHAELIPAAPVCDPASGAGQAARMIGAITNAGNKKSTHFYVNAFDYFLRC